MKKVSVLITDDHALVRESLKFILDKDHRFEVVATCSSGKEALERTLALRPNVVIVDINMPEIDGIETTKLIRRYSPGTKVLGLSLHSQPSYALKMKRESACGYITKNSSIEELIFALLEVSEGRQYLCNEVRNIISDGYLDMEDNRRHINSLSIREIEIIDEVRKGLSSKEIASLFNISEKTVQIHRYNILKKLHVSNTASLVALIASQPEFADQIN